MYSTDPWQRLAASLLHYTVRILLTHYSACIALKIPSFTRFPLKLNFNSTFARAEHHLMA